MSKNRPVSPAEVLAPASPACLTHVASRVFAGAPRAPHEPSPAPLAPPDPDPISEGDFLDLDGGAADAPELGNLDGSSTMVQGQVNVPPTEVPREFGKMSNTENVEPLNHQKTDRPPPGHALHESAGVHPNEHHAGAPSFEDPEAPPLAPLSELEPPRQLTIPSLPEDGAAVFGEVLAEEHGNERDSLAERQRFELVELEELGTEFMNGLTRLSTVTGCNRSFLLAEWIRLGQHLLDCNLARNEIRGTFETLEGVLTLMAAARNLRANLGLITHIDVETLAGAFMSWMRPPTNPVTPKAQPASPPKQAPRRPPPGESAAVADRLAISSSFPSGPKTLADTPLAKSHKKQTALPPAEDPKVKRERERLAKEQEKEKARALKEAEKLRAQKRRELELELKRLGK